MHTKWGSRIQINGDKRKYSEITLLASSIHYIGGRESEFILKAVCMDISTLRGLHRVICLLLLRDFSTSFFFQLHSTAWHAWTHHSLMFFLSFSPSSLFPPFSLCQLFDVPCCFGMSIDGSYKLGQLKRKQLNAQRLVDSSHWLFCSVTHQIKICDHTEMKNKYRIESLVQQSNCLIYKWLILSLNFLLTEIGHKSIISWCVFTCFSLWVVLWE